MNMKYLITFVMGTLLISALHSKEVTASLEESLELKRISEYWNEKDYSTVKIQIGNFLNKNPKSAFTDQLYAMLGDLYFQEKNYADAIAAYDKILGKEFLLKCQYHLLHSLYETKQYEKFIRSSELFLKNPNAPSNQINIIRYELAESYFHIENPAEKKEFLEKALDQYEKVIDGQFSILALQRCAQIHSLLQRERKAIPLYLLLAHKDSANKEDWLLQAATAQIHFDVKSAIATFGDIVELKGENVALAAFNKLCLLFKEKRYKDFILEQDKAMRYIASDKIPLMQYYLGKSLYATNQFALAVDPLLKGIGSIDRPQKKNALLTLVACANELGDLTLFAKTLESLKTEFTQDLETAKALLMYAQSCREKNELAKSRESIKELLRLYPEHPQRETLLFDSALMLSDMQHWEESALEFAAFLNEFPNTAHRASALRHSVSLNIENVKRASASTQKIKQETLLHSLEIALQEKQVFSASEKQKMRYLVAKMHFELGSFERAIGALTEYVKDYLEDPHRAEAYLLLAHCYKQSGEDEIHFVLSAEKALSLNPKLELELGLSLYNSYLKLAEKAELEEKAELIAKAANHLYLCLDDKISLENQRWLASYYFQQYENGNGEAVARAAIVLEKLIGNHSLSIANEGEAIKLAQIFEKTGRTHELIELLERVKTAHDSHPDLPWKYQRKIQFERALAYRSLGNLEKAVEIFSDLIATSSHTSSYYSMAASLEKAKIEFGMLKNQKLQADSPSMIAILDALKDLAIQRRLYSEPLHLEAALCYVDFKAELKSCDKQFLLEKVKENFFQQSDPSVQEYLMAASHFPEKAKLHQQYRAYLNAELLKIEAVKNNDANQMREVKQQFEKLLADAIDDTLKERVKRSQVGL